MKKIEKIAQKVMLHEMLHANVPSCMQAYLNMYKLYEHMLGAQQ